jgi:hypothetical protein
MKPRPAYLRLVPPAEPSVLTEQDWSEINVLCDPDIAAMPAVIEECDFEDIEDSSEVDDDGA